MTEKSVKDGAVQMTPAMLEAMVAESGKTILALNTRLANAGANLVMLMEQNAALRARVAELEAQSDRRAPGESER